MKKTNAQLIIVICNYDYVDDVMEVAKKVGARGGTIVHGRGTMTKETTKFFGITIQPEKGLLMILASEEQQEKIMKAINEEKGLTTEAHAISFCLPVEDYRGFKL